MEPSNLALRGEVLTAEPVLDLGALADDVGEQVAGMPPHEDELGTPRPQHHEVDPDTSMPRMCPRVKW
jgi:hypothetical protein